MLRTLQCESRTRIPKIAAKSTPIEKQRWKLARIKNKAHLEGYLIAGPMKYSSFCRDWEVEFGYDFKVELRSLVARVEVQDM